MYVVSISKGIYGAPELRILVVDTALATAATRHGQSFGLRDVVDALRLLDASNGADDLPAFGVHLFHHVASQRGNEQPPAVGARGHVVDSALNPLHSDRAHELHHLLVAGIHGAERIMH